MRSDNIRAPRPSRSGYTENQVSDHTTDGKGALPAPLVLDRSHLVQWTVLTNGKAERFFRTFRIWQRVTLFAWRLASIQRKLDVYRSWYNSERPLHGLDCRTPDELWAGANSPGAFAVPLRENDPVKPALSVERLHYRGDPNLIQLDIQIVRSVKRSA